MSNSAQTDMLAKAARAILGINAAGAYTALVPSRHGPDEARAELSRLSAESVLSVPVKHLPDAQAIVSGLWLWHDYLEESHSISQGISGATGSYWHAIMHRREGDFSNSKYWNARCRGHSVLGYLAARVNEAIGQLPPDRLVMRITRGGYDPDAFVDLVEEVHGKPGDARFQACVSIQRIEWQLLLDHCIREAAGV